MEAGETIGCFFNSDGVKFLHEGDVVETHVWPLWSMAWNRASHGISMSNDWQPISDGLVIRRTRRGRLVIRDVRRNDSRSKKFDSITDVRLDAETSHEFIDTIKFITELGQ